MEKNTHYFRVNLIDPYFTLRAHDALTSLEEAVCWLEKEEKRKAAALYAIVRLVFSNGVKREDLLSELEKTFKYSHRSATRVLNPIFKSSLVNRNPVVERQLNNKRGRPKKEGLLKKRGQRVGIYEFAKAAPKANSPKLSLTQIGQVWLYDRDLLEHRFRLPFSLAPSYRDAMVKALTACGCKDIYEGKLSSDDLIADRRFGMGCLLLTFFKMLGAHESQITFLLN